MPCFCDQHGVFPLCAWLAVGGAGGPAVDGIDDGFAHSGVDHRLDSKGHAGGKRDGAAVVVVRDLGRLMEVEADAVGDELVDDRTVAGFCMVLDCPADLVEFEPRL